MEDSTDYSSDLGDDQYEARRAFFILDNFPSVFFDTQEFYQPNLSPTNQNPVDVLACTYEHAVQTILESDINSSGNLGGIYINLRKHGYLEITPQAQFSWNTINANSFPNLLCKLFNEGRIQQDAIIRHPKSIRHLISGATLVHCQVIGCYLSEDRMSTVNDIRDCLDVISSDQSLLFMIGNYREYRELAKLIDHFVQVTDYEPTSNETVSIMCHEVQRKWNLM